MVPEVRLSFRYLTGPGLPQPVNTITRSKIRQPFKGRKKVPAITRGLKKVFIL
jgi:hypothetical protein